MAVRDRTTHGAPGRWRKAARAGATSYSWVPLWREQQKQEKKGQKQRKKRKNLLVDFILFIFISPTETIMIHSPGSTARATLQSYWRHG
jgi:hypothetical protein